MEALRGTVEGSNSHLRTICQFSLNQPPMRPKIDRQSFDELKPGVDSALALLNWYEELQRHLVGCLRQICEQGAKPSPDMLSLMVQSIDACVVLENQFGGWSNCINRFSWFKRVFLQLRSEVAREIDPEQLQRDLSRFQAFIGEPSYPIGMHMTGPLRAAVQKVAGYEQPLLEALFQLTAAATAANGAEPAAETLRPLPYLLYLVDGDGGGYNVFDGRAKLAPVQRVFRKHPMAECAPPAELITELGLPPGHPIHLGTVLARCPHYLASMRKKWGLPKTADEADGCGCAVC